jgi:hypothetical protein
MRKKIEMSKTRFLGCPITKSKVYSKLKLKKPKQIFLKWEKENLTDPFL